ncbi:hypothetical protein CTI12_AA274050 [Artemisia annua]|uniref:Uncharacterized protein n=1 Tax=Artemisia annua TaxID=35608 RepID=A0A2U1NEX6_ARTAN|nr:hypothetical protein CTI12_AA274050 [Artemisia annua]
MECTPSPESSPSPKDAMPWVGLYVAGASLACTLAMTADALQGFRQWKLWFPNKFFALNTVSITLIAIAMKLPVDLTTSTTEKPPLNVIYSGVGYSGKVRLINEGDWNAKMVSIAFLLTMLANLLPSLGLMDDKELLVNVVAWSILLITITWVFSVAFTVPASRRILEHSYKKWHGLASYPEEIKFSYEELEHNVKKYWMMAKTGNPQFAIACSDVASAFGVIGLIPILISLVGLFDFKYPKQHSDYKWSLKVIVNIQSIGVLIGSIAPALRCFAAINYFELSKKWSVNHLNIFKVEEHWTQMFQIWKGSHVRSHIPGRHCKIVFHISKNLILNICIALQITVVVICKLISLVPRSFLILISYCWYFCKLLIRISRSFRVRQRSSPTSTFKRNQKFLESSSSDINSHFRCTSKHSWRPCEGLIASMREGLRILRNIEECLNADSKLVKTRKAARRVWTQVEVYRKWLQIDLRKKAHDGKTSKEILEWLRDEAVKIVIQIKSCKRRRIDDSRYKFIAASSMYRVSQTILIHCSELENWPTDGKLLEWISNMIADILCACFTNLPRTVKMMCHHDAIEKREDSVRSAAQLLGRSRKILEILNTRQLPNIDVDSMAYISKWHALPKSEIPNGAPLNQIQLASPSPNESVTVNIGVLFISRQNLIMSHLCRILLSVIVAQESFDCHLNDYELGKKEHTFICFKYVFFYLEQLLKLRWLHSRIFVLIIVHFSQTKLKRLVEIVGKFDKNITRRGSLHGTSTKKGNNHLVGPVMIGFFVFVVIGSSPFQIMRTTSGGMA